MRWLIVVLALIVAAPVFAEDGEKAWHEDWFGQLELRSGVAKASDAEEWQPFASIPMLGYKDFALELGVAQDGAVFGAVTYDLGSLEDVGIEVFWAKYVNVHLGVYAGRNYGAKADDIAVEDDFEWGFAITLIDLSFDEGNAEKQKSARRE